MSLTFDLDAVLRKSSVGEGYAARLASETMLPLTRWSRPWQALPLALYRLINWWGEKNSPPSCYGHRPPWR